MSEPYNDEEWEKVKETAPFDGPLCERSRLIATVESLRWSKKHWQTNCEAFIKENTTHMRIMNEYKEENANLKAELENRNIEAEHDLP